jgi:hypothetical protein
LLTLAITAPPPAVEELDDPESVDEPEFDVSVEEDESADEVVVESEEPDDPEDPEEEPEDPEVPEEPLFTLLIVTVHVLTSWKAGLPFESVIGVSVMTQVCVMSPATLVGSEYKLAVEKHVAGARRGCGLGHDSCGPRIGASDRDCIGGCKSEEQGLEKEKES